MADYRHVANTLIQLAEQDQKPLSLMQLLKLMYFAHGLHLALSDEPLLNDPFEAWKFGPVHRPTYVKYRSDDIHRVNYGTEYDADSHKWVAYVLPSGPERTSVELAWQEYKEQSAWELSDLTHATDGPWDQLRKLYPGENFPPRTYLDNSSIRDWFKTVVNVHS